MNLTVICPHFAPDSAPTGEVMTSIAHELVGRGHRLHVVTALPWYQDHRVERAWRGRLVRHEDTPSGRITRVHPFPTDKTNIPARALAFGGFTLLAGAAGLWTSAKGRSSIASLAARAGSAGGPLGPRPHPRAWPQVTSAKGRWSIASLAARAGSAGGPLGPRPHPRAWPQVRSAKGRWSIASLAARAGSAGGPLGPRPHPRAWPQVRSAKGRWSIASLAARAGSAGGPLGPRPHPRAWPQVRSTRPDAVLAMSPPLTLGLAGWAVARLRRVPFVFNIQDVFPDVAVELGVLQGRRVIAAASWLERFTYLRADAVTVLSDDLRDNVEAKIGDPADDVARVRVIPNFIDTDWITPGPPDNAYRREHDLLGRTVVMYAGNVGLSQSLELVLAAAAALAEDPRVVFVVNGGGAARPELERRARGLDNIRFVDMQPKARLPEVLAAGDVHVVPLKRGLARSSVPSKLYSILAAGRPIVASVDPGTEVARTVTEAGAGLAVPPDDPEAFTKAVLHLVDAPDEAAAMGAAGRRFVERWASPAAVAGAYDDLFAELIVRRRATRRWRRSRRR